MGVYRRKPAEYPSNLSPLKLLDQTHASKSHQSGQDGTPFSQRCCYATHARGTEYQSHRKRPLSNREKWAELVPELGNPFDPFAVAVDIGNERIGYVSTNQSLALHWRVYALNAEGRSCQVPVDLSASSATLTIPTFRKFDRYISLEALLDEVKNLYTSLPESTRTEIEEGSGFHISEDWQWTEIRRKARMAPSVAFPDNFDPSRSHPLFDLFFREYRPARREQIKQRKKDETATRRAKADAERLAARLAKRAERDDEVLEMLLDGKPKTHIKNILGVSDDRINRVIDENDIEPPAGSSPIKTRIQNGNRALALSRQGVSNGRIMMMLGVGDYRLKELISLARFLEDPESNRPRLDLAILAYQNNWTESSAPPGKSHKRAVQDAKDIVDIESYME